MSAGILLHVHVTLHMTQSYDLSFQLFVKKIMHSIFTHFISTMKTCEKEFCRIKTLAKLVMNMTFRSYYQKP